jgi:8-oxo-dGTP pyrophosphatase MutT (NUDIX family)
MKNNTKQAASDSGFFTRVRQRIEANHHPVSLGWMTPACVFLLLYERDGKPYIPAILKADNPGYVWANQVALPGGKIDQADPSPLHAAFRELEEELGITRPHVETLGSIGHFQTLKHTEIEVFAGVWDRAEPIRYDRSEISRMLDIPLDHLMDTHLTRNLAGRDPGWDELLYPVDDLVIWGVTAKIIHYFMELILDGQVRSFSSSSGTPGSPSRR